MAFAKEAAATQRANIHSLRLSYLPLSSGEISTFQSALAPLAASLTRLDLSGSTFNVRQDHAWCSIGLKWMFFRAIGALKNLQVCILDLS
jgi:hypothetical protein